MNKKIFRRTFTIFLALMCCLSVVACGKKDDNKYSDRPRTVTLAYYYGGYGKDYMEALAKEFMDNYDSEIYLKLKDVHDIRMRDRIQAKTPDGDIEILAMDMFNNTAHLENLDIIYESVPLGETKTVAEKIGEKYSSYYTEKTGKYQLPATSMLGYNWVYNKTTLKEAFGGEKYTLPRTSEEFFEFGTKLIEEKSVYLTSAALNDSNGGDYLVYAFQNWFAQMMGLEAYEKFYDGLYLDSTEWKLSEEKPYIIQNNKTAIESAYTAAYKLSKQENNYLHSASSSVNYIQNDILFAGGGYMSQKAKTAFLYTGAWYEKEIEEQIKSGRITKQELGVMKSPVISDIVKRFENPVSEETLRLLVSAIDEGKTSFEGVSEKEFNIVKEARNMVTEQVCSEIVVPKIKDERKREDIYKVLRYIATDNAQKVVIKATGGVNLMPFGYKPDYEELGVTVDDFITEFNEIAENSVIVDYACVNKLFKQSSGVQWYRGTSGGALVQQVYEGTAYKPEDIYNKTIGYYSDDIWNNIIEVYKNKKG